MKRNWSEFTVLPSASVCFSATISCSGCRCGQKGTDLNLPFRQLLGEVLSEVAAFDSRLLRTLRPFLTRPGLLAVEYNAGRRVHYVPPIRFYVFISFVVFLTAALGNDFAVECRGDSDDAFQYRQVLGVF